MERLITHPPQRATHTMTNDLNMSHLKLIGSVVFQPEFNDFEAIDATQAGR